MTHKKSAPKKRAPRKKIVITDNQKSEIVRKMAGFTMMLSGITMLTGKSLSELMTDAEKERKKVKK